MKNNIFFEDLIRFSTFSLVVSGIQTKPKTNKTIFDVFIERYLIYFEIWWLYCDIIAEFFCIIESIRMGKSIVEICLITPCIIISIMSTFKVIFIFKGKSVLINILNKIQDVYPTFENYELDTEVKGVREVSDGEKTIVAESMQLLNFVTKSLIFIYSFVMISFLGLPIISMALEYGKTGLITYKLPFLATYFFNPLTFYLWPFIYVHQVLATMIVCFSLLASELLYFLLCTYLTMSFRLLCFRIEHLVLIQNDPDLKKRVENVVKNHQELIQLTKDVEYLYSRPTLFHILASSILICLSAFNIVFSSDIQATIAFSTFLVLSLFQILLVCYSGDMIMHSSSKVIEAVYKSKWYLADLSSQKSLLLIMIRALQPSKLTAANFADINLSAFTTILSRSWSYFALLQTTYAQIDN